MRPLFWEPRPFPGQDPWIVPFEGSFLLIQATANNRKIAIRRFTDFARMDRNDETIIWSPDRRSNHARQIWAPELHCIEGRWFVYYAASDGQNRNHRSYALEADHPLGPYRDLGKIFDAQHDEWSIDMTVLRHNGQLYAVWSGWDSGDDPAQNLYIAPMANGWTISAPRTLISRPEHPWEMSVARINEGPEVLRNTEHGKLFIVYSADASWSPAYKMGLLEWVGGDVTDPDAWRKQPQPVFSGGGHGCFVKLDDGYHVVYHRKLTTEPGWADREIRSEHLEWDGAGYPVIGRRGAAGVPAQIAAVPQRPAAVPTSAPTSVDDFDAA